MSLVLKGNSLSHEKLEEGIILRICFQNLGELLHSVIQLYKCYIVYGRVYGREGHHFNFYYPIPFLLSSYISLHILQDNSFQYWLIIPK